MFSYNLNIDLSYCEKLDKFALLTDQPYNLGNKGVWFGCFRGGLYGMYSRVYGIQFHNKLVHSWESKLTQMRQVDFHVSSILFNMDSVLECFTFGINALGWIVEDSLFKSVTSESDLKKINPFNIIGNSSRPPVPGYAKYFPTLQKHWKNSVKLIEKVIEHHDVSKHRESVVSGGQLRQDPPAGFEIEIEIEGRKISHSPFLNFQEILLTNAPKQPSALRSPADTNDLDVLEKLTSGFVEFIQESFKLAYEDAVASIKLSVPAFRK